MLLRIFCNKLNVTVYLIVEGACVVSIEEYGYVALRLCESIILADVKINHCITAQTSTSHHTYTKDETYYGVSAYQYTIHSFCDACEV